MEVIPGMDLLGKKVTSAEGIAWIDDFTANHDPISVAKFWKEQGAERLYVADLEGARYGNPMALDIIRGIKDKVDIKISLGGGIRNAQSAKNAFDAGVDKIVIGTYAALENTFAKHMFDTYNDKVIVSLGNLNGYVAIHDWTVRLDETIFEFAEKMQNLGAKCIVYNDISRKGAHGGPNMYMIKKMLEHMSIPLIVGCGISNVDDIKALKKLDGILGVIMVSALYQRLISYRDAIEAAN